MQNKNKNVKNDAIEQGINNREYGAEYGIDTTVEYPDMPNRMRTDKGGSFSGDPSEMRKAPGYNGSVPGVNTPEISLPGAENRQDVSIPAFNPPVPNRAWTEMRKNLKIEMMSEAEKRDLYGNKKNTF